MTQATEAALRTIHMSPETVRNITNGLRRDTIVGRALAKPLLSRLRDGWDKLDVDEVAHTLATGRDSAFVEEARHVLKGTPLAIDPITRRLLEWLGTDADGALLLAAIASPDQITLGATLRCATPGAPTATVSVPFSPELSWSAPQNEIFMVQTMPETLANVLPGRRLREWLSHPVLDDYDIAITSVRATGIATRVGTDAIQAIADLDPDI